LSIKAKEFERELKKENMKVIEKDILETVDISVTEVTPERYQMMKLSGDYETFYVLRDEVRLKRELKVGDNLKGAIINNRIVIMEQESII